MINLKRRASQRHRERKDSTKKKNKKIRKR